MCVKKSLRSGALGRIKIIKLAQQVAKLEMQNTVLLAVLDGAHFVLLCSSQEQMRFSTTVSKTSNQKYLWSKKQIGTCLYCMLPIHLVDSAKHSEACAANSETCLLYSVYHIFLGRFNIWSSSLYGETKYTLKMILEHSHLSSIKGSADALYWLKDKSFHFGHEPWRLRIMEADNIV